LCLHAPHGRFAQLGKGGAAHAAVFVGGVGDYSVNVLFGAAFAVCFISEWCSWYELQGLAERERPVRNGTREVLTYK
jgi:hypothetical protein